MAAKNFIILKNRDLAITKGATGCARIAFTQSDLDNITEGVKATTVTFDTLNPCVAVVDEAGVQWDLNSKRVRYNTATNKTTVDLIDILYAKGLITTPATITTACSSTSSRAGRATRASWRSAQSTFVLRRRGRSSCA